MKSRRKSAEEPSGLGSGLSADQIAARDLAVDELVNVLRASPQSHQQPVPELALAFVRIAFRNTFFGFRPWDGVRPDHSDVVAIISRFWADGTMAVTSVRVLNDGERKVVRVGIRSPELLAEIRRDSPNAYELGLRIPIAALLGREEQEGADDDGGEDKDGTAAA
ncbi:hypothetical protein KGQ24_01160 [Patescibacteria group bacterium]|nr:hypothetical protein [Patescibacteria group bacterium]